GGADGVVDGPVEVALPALAGRHARDDVRAVLHHLAGVERALLAGEALDDDAGVAVYEDGHGVGDGWMEGAEGTEGTEGLRGCEPSTPSILPIPSTLSHRRLALRRRRGGRRGAGRLLRRRRRLLGRLRVRGLRGGRRRLLGRLLGVLRVAELLGRRLPRRRLRRRQLPLDVVRGVL